jgi:predicted N-acetyltransferase YhbS
VAHAGGGPPTIRPARAADLPGLERLLREVFSPAVAARARWKYLDNPALPAPLVAVAEVGAGRLVGCYPFVGRRFAGPAGPRLAVLAADVAVLPAHRGGRLYADLAILAADLARAAGAAFAYGFPNPDAHRVARRLLRVRDWAMLEAWTRTLQGPGPALARRVLAGLASGPAPGAPEYPAALPPVPGAGLRDPGFLRWRFGDRRRYRARVAGPCYLVVARAGRFGRDRLVVDFAPHDDQAALGRLLADAMADARAGGAERLWVWCLPGSAMSRAAAALGLRRAPDRDKPATADPLGAAEPPPRPAHLTVADADDP